MFGFSEPAEEFVSNSRPGWDDERSLFHIGRKNIFVTCQRIIGPYRDPPSFIERKTQKGKPFRVGRLDQKPHIEHAVIKTHPDVVGRHVVELETDAGIPFVKFDHELGHELRSHAFDTADRDGPGNLSFSAGEFLSHPIGEQNELLCSFAKQDPFLGQRYLAFSPDKQRRSQFFFQIMKLAGQSGLGHKKGLRSRRNISLLDNGQKIS